jgi:hypothetical protein
MRTRRALSTGLALTGLALTAVMALVVGGAHAEKKDHTHPPARRPMSTRRGPCGSPWRSCTSTEGSRPAGS